MALSSGICLIYRRLHHCPLSSRWLQDRLTHPVKLLHGSSIRSNYQSRLMELFKASPKRSMKLKLKDQVPKDFSLIYKAPMEYYMKYGYPVTLLMFLAAPSLMMYHYYVNGEILLRRQVSEIVFLDAEKEIWFFSGALTLCTWAIFAVLFKYPVRLYKHNEQQKYIAMYLSAIPLRTTKYPFTQAAQKKFKNPLYSFVQNCHYVLEGDKKAILYPDYFRSPADLCEMIGMD